jgi:hypothetical protein
MSSTAYDDQWSVEPLPNGDFKVVYANNWEDEQNTVRFFAGSPNTEMLKISPKGFWVRGVKVEQDDKEAERVYNAFKQWMVWCEMNRR